MLSDSSFNEMFLDQHASSGRHVLGKVNERLGSGAHRPGNERVSISTGRYMVLKREFDELLERSHATRRNGEPLTKDPLVRQTLAQAHVRTGSVPLNTLRAVTAPFKGARPVRRIAPQSVLERNEPADGPLRLEVLGFKRSCGTADEGQWAFNYLRARGNSIEGGTERNPTNIVASVCWAFPRAIDTMNFELSKPQQLLRETTPGQPHEGVPQEPCPGADAHRYRI